MMGGSGHQRESHITLPGAVRKIFKEDLKRTKNLANQQREEPRASQIQAQKRKCLRNVIKRGQNGN